jgi:hypothetical protein
LEVEVQRADVRRKVMQQCLEIEDEEPLTDVETLAIPALP